ncbi:MAG: class fructose-bisphosphate aldolase [Frankiales bacterium]|nr:class fructose-bisphosphate aldolase [Frankiales bacterium]
MREMLDKVRSAPGFVAALDQSGGSTPKALRLYGLDESSWSNEQEMYDLMHQMRCRIITSPAFTGDRILAAILFEMTMDREIQGRGTAEFLWEEKQVVPFLKVDKGLAEQADGVQLLKPIPELGSLLERAMGHGIFGTKMRSVVALADPVGIGAVVDQQLAIGRQILDVGLVPIIEPEVDIHSPQKAAAEELLTERLLAALSQLDDGQQVMVKLTLPETEGLYTPLLEHPRVLRVLALSGGYSREEADARLARNHGVIASFSRALTEGLSAQQTQAEFDRVLDASIQSIYQASIS